MFRVASDGVKCEALEAPSDIQAAGRCITSYIKLISAAACAWFAAAAEPPATASETVTGSFRFFFITETG